MTSSMEAGVGVKVGAVSVWTGELDADNGSGVEVPEGRTHPPTARSRSKTESFFVLFTGDA
jgi:hypothetical protein